MKPKEISLCLLLNHSIIQANLIRELGVLYKKEYRIVSELSLGLSDWPSVPDICIYPKMPIDLHQDKIAMTEAPLCAIEIGSPNQAFNNLIYKVRKHFCYGIRSCWAVLLPLGNIHVFFSPDEYEIYRASDTLRDTKLDIELPLKEVFE